MMKRALSLACITIGLLSVGAKGQSCSVDADPGDGSAKTWQVGATSKPSAPTPMTCGWLEGTNCWKDHVMSALACGGSLEEKGTFAVDRRSCFFPSGKKIEFDGEVATPKAIEKQISVLNFRLLDKAGAPCFTALTPESGRTIIDVAGTTALIENITVTDFRVTCPNGKTYSNEALSAKPDAPDDQKVCASAGQKWLEKKVPGVLLGCDGAKKTCTIEIWGGPTGQVSYASCGW
jgi:hypothetical protein